MNSIANRIAKRIRTQPRGSVFTPKDFLSLGTRATIDQTLSRLAKQGLIRRLARGIYDYPKHSKLIGVLSPDTDQLAQAITVGTGKAPYHSGAMAANVLGLSTQVPVKPVYLTNGPSRVKKIAGRTIFLKHTRIPLTNDLPDRANLVLQALSFLGKKYIDSQTIRICANKLDDADMSSLLNMLAQIPGWMVDTIHKIKQEKYGHVRQAA